MPVTLRVRRGKLVVVDSRLLDPESGCGLMLARNVRYETNDVFRDIMRRYGFPNLFADRAAQKIMEEREDLMRVFCHNVDANRVGLELNFRTVYESCGLVLALDSPQQAAHFVAGAENYLALTNYCRDAIPGVARSLGITISGWPERLVAVGWQNLYDVTKDPRLLLDYPDLKQIDITPGVPAVEWHGPVLELAANALNLSDARTIRETIRSKAEKQAVQLRLRQDAAPESEDPDDSASREGVGDHPNWPEI